MNSDIVRLDYCVVAGENPMADAHDNLFHCRISYFRSVVRGLCPLYVRRRILELQNLHIRDKI